MKRIVLRVFAVLLSLASPGCGHFLIGTFRRGVAWVVGSTVLGMTMMFLGVLLFSRYRFPSMLIAVLVGILLVRIVAAIDTVSLTPQKHSWKMFVLAWATLLSSAGLFDFLVTPYYIAHFVQAFSVPASSMEPTLLVGDRILSDNSFYDSRPPQQGDIVVFRYPLDPATYFVKRVIGVPGDRIRIEGSLLYRNGVALDEPYAAYKSLRPRNERDNFPILPSPTAFPEWADELVEVINDGELVVPEGRYFVMGDNRDFSSDSRYWGFVPRGNILGKPVVIYLSFDSSDDEFRRADDRVSHFPPKTRWDRLFRPIE